MQDSEVLNELELGYGEDASIDVVSWSATRGTLVLRIVDDGADYTGLIRFRGVFQVNLPPRLSDVRIECGGKSILPESLRGYYTGELDVGLEQPVQFEKVFLFRVPLGPTYFVIAESIEHEAVRP